MVAERGEGGGLTFTDQLLRRLAVPCTPTELAQSFGKPVTLIRAFLHQLKRQRRAERMDRAVEIDKSGRASKRGHKREHLWQRKRTVGA